MLGQALAYAPNVNTAVVSAKNLFALLDREPLIKSSPEAKPLKGWVKIKTFGFLDFVRSMNKLG